MTDNKELIPGMTDIINHIKKLEEENKKLKEDVIFKDNIINDYKREVDTEHQRYLEAIEKGSNNLWEISNVLDMEHHGGNKDIIEKIKDVKEEGEKIEEAIREVGDGDTINACVAIWYGEEEDNEEESEEEEEEQTYYFKGFNSNKGESKEDTRNQYVYDDTLSNVENRIAKDVPFIDYAPYSHNIIGLALSSIFEQEGGKEEVNRIIDKYDLVSKGWSKK